MRAAPVVLTLIIPAIALATTPGDILVLNHDLKHAAFGGSQRRRMFTMNCCQRYPDDKLTVIVLCNLAAPLFPGLTVGGDPEAVASGVAGLVVPALADKKK